MRLSRGMRGGFRRALVPGFGSSVAETVGVFDSDRVVEALGYEEASRVFVETPHIVIGCCGDDAVENLREMWPDFWCSRFFSSLSSIPDRGPAGLTVVIGAGTADLVLCRSVAGVCRSLGCRVEVISDVGVAGLHRLAAVENRLAEARVVVVCAGMEAALASIMVDVWPGPIVFLPNGQGIGVASGGAAAFASGLAVSGSGLIVCLPGDAVGAALIASRVNLA